MLTKDFKSHCFDHFENKKKKKNQNRPVAVQADLSVII